MGALTANLDAALGPPPEHHMRTEVIVLRVRKHGGRLVLPVLALMLIAGASGTFIGALPETWMNLAAAALAALLTIFLCLGPMLSWLASRTIVTSRRVIQRRGVLSQHRSEVALGRVREVRLSRRPLQRLLGSGDIDLLVGAENWRIFDVPGAVGIAAALQELVERNFQLMDTGEPELV